MPDAAVISRLSVYGSFIRVSWTSDLIYVAASGSKSAVWSLYECCEKDYVISLVNGEFII